MPSRLSLFGLTASLIATSIVVTNPAVAQSRNSLDQPQVATVKNMVNGDLMCYVTLVDQNGIQKQVGATFEICEQKNAFLNKKVNLVYRQVSVNDCQSIEPCGKTRRQSLIVQMKLADLSDRVYKKQS
jgi:biopolymer transport protein ExbD